MTGSAYRSDLYPNTKLGPFVRREAAVYILDPPLLHAGGVTDHVIVVANPRAHVVDVFPCYETGLIAAWEPLNEFTDGVDHAKALRAMGYEAHYTGSNPR